MLHATTFKTLLGYFKTKLGWSKTSQNVDEIYNFLPIHDQLATSGQPNTNEFSLIQQCGYQTIINLAPTDADNALENEAAIVSALNLNYIHLPVDFKAPTQEDFEQFCQIMQQHTNQKIWVHCAANMRVSAFIYKYRRDVLRDDEKLARSDLERIWQPYGVWKEFLEKS